MLGAQKTDRARQPLRTSGARELTEVKVPVADTSRGRSDGEIASQQKLQASRNADAIDGGDIDFVGRLDRTEQLEEFIEEGRKLFRIAVKTKIPSQIPASRKTPTAAGDNDRVDPGFLLDFRERNAHFANCRPIKRIEAIGARQRQPSARGAPLQLNIGRYHTF